MPIARPLQLRQRSRRIRVAVAAITLAGAALVGVGCNYVAAAAYVIEGPPKVDAKFKLDETKRTVVFIDDRNNVVPRRSLRHVMGESVESELISKGGLDASLVIPAQSTLRATSAERLGAPMSIVDVGRLVGAEVVIYAVVTRFSLSPDGVTFTPIGTANVKVYDAVNNVPIFPLAGEGVPVTMLLPLKDSSMPTGIAEKNAAEEDAARAMGVQIARTFFSYERDKLSGDLDD
jgi:hypothetical protein